MMRGSTINFASIAALAAMLTGAMPGVAAAPVSGKLETYRDWIIGCDNGGACAAASLMPQDDGGDFDSFAALMVTRDGGGKAQPALMVRLQSALKGKVDLVVDGALLISIVAAGDEIRIAGEQSSPVIAAIARGSRFELAAGGKVVARASLSGSAAALRYMDARQGRAGTVTALVAKGPLRASAVKAPPALPVVHRLIVPEGGDEGSLWHDELAQALAISGCSLEDAGDARSEIFPLPQDKALVLFPCGAGAYNISTVPLIASGRPGRRTLTVAKFDVRPGWSEPGGVPMLVNAGWDARTGTLSSYAKGRGLGDCGDAGDYVWDGSTFRLVRATAMGECRGAWEWITTFRAQVIADRK